MTDGEQLATILTSGGLALGSVGTFVRWMFTQWMADKKEERAQKASERLGDREDVRQMTTAVVTLSMRFEAFDRALNKMEQSFESKSGVYDTNPIPEPMQIPSLPRRQTPAKGVRAQTDRPFERNRNDDR